MVETYLKRANANSCLFTGNRQSWCEHPVTGADVRPYTPDIAAFIAREKRDAKAAKMIGRDYTDLPACPKHARARQDRPETWTIYPISEVVFADDNPSPMEGL